MKCYYKSFFLALLAVGIILIPDQLRGRSFVEPLQEEAAEEETDYTEEEYNAYMSASNEPDYEKRGAMLLDFMEKYPKSTLLSYIDSAYTALLFQCSEEKKYEQLEPLAEKWLKLHPNDLKTMAYIVTAAGQLGHDKKCVDCLEEIFKIQPSASYALSIARLHKKMGNESKYIEWIEKVFTYPEYEADYELRFDLVKKYTEEKNFEKAAEYARLTLKSADRIKSEDPSAKEQLRKVQRACHHLIGMNYFEADRFPDAIKSLQQALKAEKYAEGYYYIGMSLWNQDNVEDAMIFFAAAELQGGEIASKAKEQLESLYKPLHNNTTIGIDKVYNKARDLIEGKQLVLSALDSR